MLEENIEDWRGDLADLEEGEDGNECKEYKEDIADAESRLEQVRRQERVRESASFALSTRPVLDLRQYTRDIVFLVSALSQKRATGVN